MTSEQSYIDLIELYNHYYAFDRIIDLDDNTCTSQGVASLNYLGIPYRQHEVTSGRNLNRQD
jgi:hypothetical protein